MNLLKIRFNYLHFNLLHKKIGGDKTTPEPKRLNRVSIAPEQEKPRVKILLILEENKL